VGGLLVSLRLGKQNSSCGTYLGRKSTKYAQLFDTYFLLLQLSPALCSFHSANQMSCANERSRISRCFTDRLHIDWPLHHNQRCIWTTKWLPN
jgi:hypothetical protein